MNFRDPQVRYQQNQSFRPSEWLKDSVISATLADPSALRQDNDIAPTGCIEYRPR
jgi:hypothetical protein